MIKMRLHQLHLTEGKGVLFLEGYRIIEPFDFDRAVLHEPDIRTSKVVRNILYQAAVRFQWQTLSGTADSYTITGFDKKEFSPDPLSLIWTQSYMQPNTRELDVLMLHFYVDHEKKTWNVVAYVFPQPKVNSEGHAYYEHSNFCIFQKDSCIVFEQVETYADHADIHDHDHYELSAQAIYDISTRTLYYPEN